MKKCRLCGKEEKLTFEHVPPKVAFNDQMKKTVRAKDSIDIIVGSKTFDEIDGYSRKGQTFKTLCKSCNNFLGAEYVPEYSSLANNLMASYKREGELPKVGTGYYIEIPIKPLNFLKQVLSMFCSIVSEEANEEFDFKEFILDKKQKGEFSKKYKVGMYGFVGKTAFMGGPSVSVDMESGKIHQVVNIEHIPFGFMLVDKEFEFSDGIADLQELAKCDYNQELKTRFEFGIFGIMEPMNMFRK
ncbi:hypothetical protein ACWOAS_11605 [Lactococcus lactis subsp. lactis]